VNFQTKNQISQSFPRIKNKKGRINHLKKKRKSRIQIVNFQIQNQISQNLLMVKNKKKLMLKIAVK
jgi:hypothetical protein